MAQETAKCIILKIGTYITVTFKRISKFLFLKITVLTVATTNLQGVLPKRAFGIVHSEVFEVDR